MDLEDRSFLTPSAPMGGVVLPDPGYGLLMGKAVPEESAILNAARKIAGARNPTIFPGPLVLWTSTPDSVRMAGAVLRLAQAGSGKTTPPIGADGVKNERSSRSMQIFATTTPF